MAVTEPTNAPVPPHDLDAEESVLGAIMLPGAALEAIQAEGLQPADFYRASHGRIYLAALDLQAHGVPVDAIAIADYLQAQRGQDHRTLLEDIGGKERIHELATLVPAASNAYYYARIVVEKAGLRRQAQAGELLVRRAYESQDAAQALTDALELLDPLRAGQTLTVETWHQFESQAHNDVPMLIDGLWPEAAFGFIAAPPKKGKTWVAIAVAVAVATGKQLFGQFDTPEPRPVLYVALEGHRAALRARVGAIARGLDVNPDGNDLDQLHWLYKPAGINLAEPAWAQRLKRAADQVDAALVIVDVLRAGARIKENDQADFSNLRANLQPINDAGRSLAMLHHNVKLSEISKERDPGERMSGTGAMYGALDTAIYITGSEDHARKLRLEFDMRDGAASDPISIQLQGDGTGPGGGFAYTDTATFQLVDDEVEEENLKAPARAIYDYIAANGGHATGTEIRAHFGEDDKLLAPSTLASRITALERLGVTVETRRGNRGNLFRIDTSPSIDTCEYDGTLQYEPHNHAGSPSIDSLSTDQPPTNKESGDLQEDSLSANASPYGSAPTRARTRGALHTAEQWIDAHGWMLDPNAITNHALAEWPTLGSKDLAALIAKAAELAAAEAGGAPDVPDVKKKPEDPQ